MKPVESETPQHFGESGCLLMEDGKTFLTLSKSLLHIGEVGGLLCCFVVLLFCFVLGGLFLLWKGKKKGVFWSLTW